MQQSVKQPYALCSQLSYLYKSYMHSGVAWISMFKLISYIFFTSALSTLVQTVLLLQITHTIVGVIRFFHQFRIPNLRNLSWFLFQLANWDFFLTNKKFVFFFNCSNWERFVDKIGETNWWKHLMNSLCMYDVWRMRTHWIKSCIFFMVSGCM